MTSQPSAIDRQLQASKEIADVIVDALRTDRGVHAETAVASAGRMAGTFLFRTFGLPTSAIAPGSPILSDIANERGPVLVEVLKSGLSGLGLSIDEGTITSEASGAHQPQLTFLETQQRLEPKLTPIAAAHRLTNEDAARSCALAAALLTYRTREVLDPAVSLGLVVLGFVEGTKTVPAPIAGEKPSRPWYKLW